MLTHDEVEALRRAVAKLGYIHMGVAIHPGAILGRLSPAECDACARIVIEKMIENRHGKPPRVKSRPQVTG